PRRDPVEPQPTTGRSGGPVSAPGTPLVGPSDRRDACPTNLRRSRLGRATTRRHHMSNDAELRRKILNGIVHRLVGQQPDEGTPELQQLSDQELEGALTYAIGLR